MRLFHVYILMLVVALYVAIMIYAFQYYLHRRTKSNQLKLPSKLIILLSQPRSGSSFIGNIISRKINSVYFYEPLYELDKHFQIDTNYANDSIRQRYDIFAESSLRNIFECNFNQEKELKRLANSPFKDFSVFSGCNQGNKGSSLSKINIQSKQHYISRCMPYIDSFNLQKDCQNNDLMVKFLEARIPKRDILYLKTLIRSDINFKILYLARDPRASLWSLLQTKWVAQSMKSYKFQNYIPKRCDEMEKNFKKAKANPKHITILRYEDLMVKPRLHLQRLEGFMEKRILDEIIKKLEDNLCFVPNNDFFKTLGLDNQIYEDIEEGDENDNQNDRESVNEEIDNENDRENEENEEENIAIEQETLRERNRRNYQCSSINKWRYKADITFVNLVEQHCSNVIKLMGYKLVNNDIRKLKRFQFSLVKDNY